jgi:putative aldouronate transport system substrate-binding protein
MMKLNRLLPAVVVIVMLASLAACTGAPAQTSAAPPESPVATGEAAPSAAQNTQPALDITAMLSHAGGIPEGTPVQNAWLALMEKNLNRKLNFTWNYIPQGEYSDKIKMVLASGDLKDLTGLDSYSVYNDYTDTGLAVELSGYMDKCPNYIKFLEDTPNGKIKAFDADGKAYGFRSGELPRLTQGIAIYRPSVYRYDIFEKEGIAIPTTLDELYAAAKQLKTLYPNSYPISTGATWAGFMTLYFANHTTNDIYWDGKAYRLGAVSDAYKEALQFANKLYTEKLLDPEFTTDTDDTTKAKALNGTNFIQMAQWYTYAAEYTNNKEADVKWVNAVFPNNPKYGQAWQSMNNVNTNTIGDSMIVINSKAKDIDTLVQLIDLQYQQDAIDLISWGIKDETYTEDASGKKVFVDEITKAENPWVVGDKWGMRASSKYRPGLQLLTDTKAFIALSSNDYCYVNGAVVEEPWETAFPNEPYPTSPMVPPFILAPDISFTDDENQMISTTITSIYTYISEMAVKFVSGEESFDKWDAYLAQLKTLGDYEAVLRLYNEKAQAYLASR